MTSGALCISYHKYARDSVYGFALALGIISIVTGVVFLIDFVLAIRNSRITVVQTRTV